MPEAVESSAHARRAGVGAARARYAARRGKRMPGTMQGLKDLVARLLARPDEIMLALGAGGELLVARLRAVLSLLVLAMPLVAALGGARTTEVVIGLAVAAPGGGSPTSGSSGAAEAS